MLLRLWISKVNVDVLLLDGAAIFFKIILISEELSIYGEIFVSSIKSEFIEKLNECSSKEISLISVKVSRLRFVILYLIFKCSIGWLFSNSIV